MCENCWIEAGSPKIDNERVREAARLANELYEKVSPVGGPLHIQLDDYNLDCFNGPTLEEEDPYAWGLWEDELDDEQKQLCRRTYQAFKVLTIDERYSALALDDGHWGPDGRERDESKDD